MELTPRSKTIDNLGIDTSIRYAKDQEYLDKYSIQATKFVPAQAQVDISLPFFSSEFESIFQMHLRNKGWAAFLIPPGYKDQKNKIFSFQLLPSLGNEEFCLLQRERIKEKVEKDKEKRKRERDQQKNQKGKDFLDEDIQLKEEEKESEKLIRLLEIISDLDKILTDINSRRNQYQKG